MPHISTRGVDRLRFGVRARRRAQLKRLALWVWLATLAAGTVGLPGADLGFDLFSSLLQPTRGVSFARLSDGASATRSLEPEGEMVALRTRTPDDRSTPDRSTDPVDKIESVIIKAADEFGLSRDYLISVAMCESSLNPYAVSPAGYYGLFQFGPVTWSEFGYGSIWDPVAQSRTAARMLAEGHHRRWPVCSLVSNH
ncbi:MAG: transglycosylase SLT domain-containing protein [Actinomycetota bacterium]